MRVVEFIDEFAESILQRRFCPSNAFLTPTGNDCYQRKIIEIMLACFQGVEELLNQQTVYLCCSLCATFDAGVPAYSHHRWCECAGVHDQPGS